ncbi:MAG: BamA/TamA family outer membrane protein [Candidatus Fibromonas sp.]|jgi:outer membrane protein assembly factor BamA|nr:BamA/TamA family outer membrane protein [Candidatus Fibromonas sp.]
MPFLVLLVLFANAAADVSPWKLQIKGATVYSEKFLTEQLDLPEEMNLISSERRNFIIRLAKVNLDDFYHNNGYFSVDISLALNEELVDSVLVENYTFYIYEGERYRFGYANMELVECSDTLVGMDRFSVPKGFFYDPEHISNDQKSIRDVYQRNGYLHISIEHREIIDTAEKKVNVYYRVSPGIQVRMGNFKSKTFRSGLLPGQIEPEEGLSDTAWLSKLWKIKRDSVVDERYFFSFRAKLFSTQLFSQVRLEDTLQANGLSDITLTVYERVPGEANYSFFFEQLYGFGVSLSSLHRNMSGSFHEVGLGAMLAENRQELSLNYAHPLLFGTSVSWISTAIRLEEKIFLNHEKLPDPTDPDVLVERWEVVNRTGLRFGFSSSIYSRNVLDFRFLRLQGEDYFKIKGELGLIFDLTDNSYDPVKGIRFAPSIGAGGELDNESLRDFGLEHGFFYTDISTFVYVPLHRHLLSAFAFSYGNIFNNAAKDDAEIFYQGGGRTLRGYPFRSVFPYRLEMQNDTLKRIGGRSPQYFRINEELRVIPPLNSLKNFQVVQFLDWVHINDSDKSFSRAQEMSVGLGLRYKWQFLTFRLDYAMKTDFDDFKPDRFRFSHIVFDLSQAI